MPINAIAPGNECRHASRSARLSTLTACGRTRCVADRTPRHPSPPTRSTSVRSSTSLGVSVGAAAGPLSPDARTRGACQVGLNGVIRRTTRGLRPRSATVSTTVTTRNSRPYLCLMSDSTRASSLGSVIISPVPARTGCSARTFPVRPQGLSVTRGSRRIRLTFHASAWRPRQQLIAVADDPHGGGSDVADALESR